MKDNFLSASTTCLPPKSVFSSEIAAYRSKGMKNRFGLRSWDTVGTTAYSGLRLAAAISAIV